MIVQFEMTVENWISWKENPPPEDIKGLFILYDDDLVYSDRYDPITKKRIFKGNPIGWKFIPRRDLNEKSIKA